MVADFYTQEGAEGGETQGMPRQNGSRAGQAFVLELASVFVRGIRVSEFHLLITAEANGTLFGLTRICAFGLRQN